MSDWLTNKGAGPWNFQEQPQKLGYINNPRWTSAPASTLEHEPCGYWLKGSPLIPFESGPLWAAGVNEYGELGFDYTSAHGAPLWIAPDFYYLSFPCYKTFREVPNALWSQISSGGSHSAHIRSDGSLWVCGLNTKGELGLGDNVTRYNLTRVGSDVDWAFVTCGGFQTFAIKTDGTMWATGENTTDNGTPPYHSLGLGDNVNRNVFTRVPGAGWKWVSSGGSHAVALKTDGTLWITGYNLYGQLGNGTAGYFPTHQSFEQVGGATNWVTAGAGALHTAALNSVGELYVTGYNLDGELGLGDLANRSSFTLVPNGPWSDVKIGGSYTIGIKGVRSSAWATGLNTYGGLGLGDLVNRNVFTQITSLPPFKQIALGSGHMMLIGADQSLWGVGHNAYGELGIDPGSYGVDQHAGEKTTFTRIGTENNWLRLWDTGWYGSSIALRTPGLVSVPGVSMSRPNPVWTSPA